MRPTTVTVPGAGIIAILLAVDLAVPAVARAEEIEVIFTEVPGHATAVVPGARDLSGEEVFTEFKAMETFGISATGRRWLLKSRNQLGDLLETMMLLGEDLDGSVLAQEGQPVHDGAPGEVYEFLGSSEPAFDSTGRYCFTARARGGDPATKQKGMYFDRTSLRIVRAESDPALGLLDVPANPTGDELFGNSFNSMHPLDDGRIGYHDNTIKNIHSSRRPAIFYGDLAFRQVDVDGIGESLWETFDMNSFRTTPGGDTWLVIGRDTGPDAEDTILVVNDVIVAREGHGVAGSAIVMADVFHVKLAPSGAWYARGDDPADDDWAMANGELIATTGSAITTGSEENWGNGLRAFAGNSAGEWVLAGNTTNADPFADEVLVLQGSTVLAREGDPIDLDGNGAFDDDAFIGRGNESLSALHANDLAYTDDGWIYFLASLRDSKGHDLGSFGTGGDAFLAIFVGPGDCPLDLDDSGAVDVGDLLLVLGAWGEVGHVADLDGSGIVDVGDLLLILGAWGPC